MLAIYTHIIIYISDYVYIHIDIQTYIYMHIFVLHVDIWYTHVCVYIYIHAHMYIAIARRGAVFRQIAQLPPEGQPQWLALHPRGWVEAASIGFMGAPCVGDPGGV